MNSVKDMRFNTRELSHLIGVSQGVITHWCSANLLKGRQDCNKWWIIMGEDLIEFLYLNPKVTRRMLRTPMTPYNAHIRDAILSYISDKPTLYSTPEIANMLNVSAQTVRNLYISGDIPVSGFTSSNRNQLVYKKDLDAFVQFHPKFRDNYMAYNEKRKRFNV